MVCAVFALTVHKARNAVLTLRMSQITGAVRAGGFGPATRARANAGPSSTAFRSWIWRVSQAVRSWRSIIWRPSTALVCRSTEGSVNAVYSACADWRPGPLWPPGSMWPVGAIL